MSSGGASESDSDIPSVAEVLAVRTQDCAQFTRNCAKDAIRKLTSTPNHVVDYDLPCDDRFVIQLFLSSLRKKGWDVDCRKCDYHDDGDCQKCGHYRCHDFIGIGVELACECACECYFTISMP